MYHVIHISCIVVLFILELVEARHDEGICDESRVFFLDSAHRLSQTLLNSEIPSVNIRGIMDPVS